MSSDHIFDRQSRVAKVHGSRGHGACTRCRSLKIKCSRDASCFNCRNAHGGPVQCIYPVRDRKVTVSEKYLKRLVAENRDLKENQITSSPNGTSPGLPRDSGEDDADQPIDARDDEDEEIFVDSSRFDDAAQLQFVDNGDRTKPLFVGDVSCTTFETRAHHLFDGNLTSGLGTRPPYFKNTSLLRISQTTFQLPRRSYAILLGETVIRFLGGDFHLLLRKTFLEKLAQTYSSPRAYCNDPVWLTKMFIVFALGESFLMKASSPSARSDVPGTDFFVQAMAHFPDMYEEADLEYIETLLLLSLYSHAINRTRSAHVFAGTAVRLSLSLGLHRENIQDERISPSEREHRHRVWWTVYSFDISSCSKLGQPALIRDDDIDTPFPSLEGLSIEEQEDFLEPQGLIASITLSQITGTIMDLIYCAPKARKRQHFVRNVHLILTRLRAWLGNLPDHLKLDPNRSPSFPSRPVASQHLQFNECIIITTRPILFHSIKCAVHNSSPSPAATIPKESSAVISALTDACIQAARNSINLISQLWIHGSIAMWGFYDTHYIFSAAIIIILSRALQVSEDDQDLIDTAQSLLQTMRDQGNMNASDHIARCRRLQISIEEMKGRNLAAEAYPHEPVKDSLQTATMAKRAPVNVLSERQELQTLPEVINDPILEKATSSTGQGPPHQRPIPPIVRTGPFIPDFRNPALAINAPLGDPVIQGFIESSAGWGGTEVSIGADQGEYSMSWMPELDLNMGNVFEGSQWW